MDSVTGPTKSSHFAVSLWRVALGLVGADCFVPTRPADEIAPRFGRGGGDASTPPTPAPAGSRFRSAKRPMACLAVRYHRYHLEENCRETPEQNGDGYTWTAANDTRQDSRLLGNDWEATGKRLGSRRGATGKPLGSHRKGEPKSDRNGVALPCGAARAATLHVTLPCGMARAALRNGKGPS